MPDTMDRAALEQPFDTSLIKTRRGGHGRQLKYVEGKHYVARLNEAFGGEWSFDILHHEVLGEEVLVRGRLTAAGVSKCEFGGSSITRSRETGEPISLADDAKAAATDCLKRCARLFGVGLDLYDDRPSRQPRQPLRPRNGSQIRTVRLGGRNGGNDQGANGPNRLSAKASADGNGGDRLSQKQLHAIWSIARDREIPEAHVRSHSLEKYGKQVEFLAKAEASELISTIQSC